MGFDTLDTGFIGCLTDSSSESNCSNADVTYTFPSSLPYNYGWTPVLMEATTGCFNKPILRVASVTHSLASDDLRFWVNCKVGNVIPTYGPQDTSHGGGGCNDAGNNLLQGRSFTKAQLIAGIDLNYYDSTNAPELDSSDSSQDGWHVTITTYDISDCPTDVGSSCLGGSTGYSATAQAWWMDAAPDVYTDGTGTFPQFDNGDSWVGTDTGNTNDWVIQLSVSPNYYGDSSSYGEDSFGAEEFKIFIQYDTSCNMSGGTCGSYSWQDAIDNDTYFSAGYGGMGNEQTFNVVEADCWNEDYIYVRYKVRAYGPCGGVLYTDESWTEAYLGEFDVDVEGVQCNGGP